METISRYLLTFLLNALWQVPLVVAVAAVVCRAMRNGPASHRHAVWISAMAAAVLLPVMSLRTTAIDSGSLRLAVPDPAHAAATLAAAGSPAKAPSPAGMATPARTISYAPATAAILLGVYALFLCWRLAKLLRSWNRTAAIWNHAAPCAAPATVERVWQRCLAAFPIHDARLLVSSSITSPVTAGAWRKIVILPKSFVTESSEDVLATAIGHELAHVARRDFFWKVLYEIACMPVSFHPAMLLVWRGIEETREMACDELVTRRLLEPGAYARSIMSIAAAMTAVPGPGFTLGVFDGDILEQRIRRLLDRPSANLRRARLLLATGLSALALCGVIASGLAISARAQGASPEMKLATEAYARGDYQAAAQHFQAVVRQEPANLYARLFLGDSLMNVYQKTNADPTLPVSAREQYREVLARDPKNIRALEGMVNVSIYSKQFPEAHDAVLKLIAENPTDASAYYTAGFIDWSTIYPEYARTRSDAGMRPETQGMIPDAAARGALRARFSSQLEEGFRMLQKALQLNPNDSDAMAYMNLLYRIKAGLVDTEADSHDAVAQADHWVEKALETKRIAAQTKSPGSAAHTQGLIAQPPPPPPPPPNMQEWGKKPAATTPSPRPANRAEVQGIFWQVAGGNIAANTLASSLKERGFTSVRMIFAGDQSVRVMVGPYNDQAAAAQAKSALEAAGIQVLREW